ncbi:uncharacterized protein LOC144553291 isoform X2 [Carex rostrata]
MDEIKASGSIKKRLELQQEVLKWIMEFSEKVETKAKATTEELNQLLDQTGRVELEMKNTVVSFNNMFLHKKIDHIILDENVSVVKKEKSKGSSKTSVPAQDYEKDILPRYKEALSVGLSSCKNLLQNTKQSKGSVLRAMSTRSPLPYIIGSEEYNHDDSCGLVTDEFTTEPLAGRYGWICDQHAYEVPQSSDLFGSQDSSNKGEAEPYVRAAQDFKAMLEAALTSPYKFYNEGTAVEGNTSGDSRNAIIEGDDETPPINLEHASTDISNLESADIYSSLVTGSLFDDSSEIIEENIVDSVDRNEKKTSDH